MSPGLRVAWEDEARHKILAKEEEKTHTRVSGREYTSANGWTCTGLKSTSSMTDGNHTVTTPNSWASLSWLVLSKRFTVR